MSKLAGTVCGIVCGKDVNANKLQLGSRLNQNAPTIIMTFDDGYANNYTIGKDIFDTYGLKFTIYLITSQIGTTNMLTVEQINALIASGYDMQCHSHTHPNFTTQTTAQLMAEFENVNSVFDANGWALPEHTAYPYGSSNAMIEAVTSTYRQTGRKYPSELPFSINVGKFVIPGFDLSVPKNDRTKIDQLKGIMDGMLTGDNKYLCIAGHRFYEDSDADPGMGIQRSYLVELINYAKSKGIAIKTMSKFYDYLRNRDVNADDGMLISEYDYLDTDNIVKSETNLVSQWSDISTLNHHLLQADEARMPVYESDGILFDSDFLKAVFTLPQPVMLYVVFKHITFFDTYFMLDGATYRAGGVQQSTPSPGMRQRVGGTLMGNRTESAPLDTFVIARIKFNGANSSIQINDTPVILSTLNATALGGLTIGSAGDQSTFSKIKVKGIRLRKYDSTDDQDKIVSQLKAKYNITF